MENVISKEGKRFYISFNPTIIPGGETALVIEDNRRRFGRYFLILNGDYRDNYEECKTLSDAKKVYKDLVRNGAKVSCWSD